MDEQIRQRLARVCEETVKPAKLSFDRSLRELGADSLSTVRFLAGIHDEFGVMLPAESLLAGMNLRDVANALHESDEAGSVPVMANRYAYFLKRRTNFGCWNVVSRLYRFAQACDVASFANAVKYVTAKHDGLRLRVTITGAEIAHVMVPASEVDPLRAFAIPADLDLQASKIWMVGRLEAEQAGTELTDDLFRVFLFSSTSLGHSWFAVIAHHVLVDAISFRIVMRDLIDAYGCFARHDEPSYTPALSFRQYCEESFAFWSRNAGLYSPAWLQLSWEKLKPLRESICATHSDNVERFSIEVSHPVEPHASSDMLLTGIARAYRKWTGQSALQLALVMHGRGEIGLSGDVSATVGWISETVPIVLDLEFDCLRLLKHAAAQIDAASLFGRSFGVLRYLSKSRNEVSALPDPDISLNINLGHHSAYHSTSYVCPETAEIRTVTLPDTQRVFLMSGGIFLRRERLYLSWDFSSRLFDAGEVGRFTRMCTEEIAATAELASQ